jgi:hypothetical protein
MIEVSVAGRSEYFAGTTMVYESLDIFRRFAGVLKGFPSTPQDTRSFELGSVDGRYEGGGVAFKFSCIDSLGHAVVRVKIISRDEVPQSADFGLRIVAGDVDTFVSELIQIDETLMGKAMLKMSTES